MTIEASFNDPTAILAWVGVATLTWTFFAGVYCVFWSHQEHSRTLWRISRHSVLFRIPAREEFESGGALSDRTLSEKSWGVDAALVEPTLGEMTPRGTLKSMIEPRFGYRFDPLTGSFSPPKDEEESDS